MYPDKKNSLIKLKGKKVLLTAGPTYEKIDPVRFIGNFSTGKMGYAIAALLYEYGAEVSLISGPTHLTPMHPLQKYIKVQSAKEMYTSSIELFPQCEVAILTAAVADYRSVSIQDRKIKSEKDRLVLEFEKTEDIARKLGQMKKSGQMIVGFALETDNEITNARKKLQEKNLDFIVLNSLRDKGAGFGYDTNKITVLDTDNKIHKFGLKLKEEVAYDLLQLISEKL